MTYKDKIWAVPQFFQPPAIIPNRAVMEPADVQRQHRHLEPGQSHPGKAKNPAAGYTWALPLTEEGEIVDKGRPAGSSPAGQQITREMLNAVTATRTKWTVGRIVLTILLVRFAGLFPYPLAWLIAAGSTRSATGTRDGVRGSSPGPAARHRRLRPRRDTTPLPLGDAPAINDCAA